MIRSVIALVLLLQLGIFEMEFKIITMFHFMLILFGCLLRLKLCLYNY